MLSALHPKILLCAIAAVKAGRIVEYVICTDKLYTKALDIHYCMGQGKIWKAILNPA